MVRNYSDTAGIEPASIFNTTILLHSIGGQSFTFHNDGGNVKGNQIDLRYYLYRNTKMMYKWFILNIQTEPPHSEGILDGAIHDYIVARGPLTTDQ